MKILKVMLDAKILLIYLEVNIRNKKQNAPTLCVQINTTHDGRPILMKEENAIKIK